MKSLLILGAGAYGRLVKEMAELLGFSKIDFLDDNQSCAIGQLQDLDKIQSRYDAAVVAIGNAKVREKYLRMLSHPATLIHPTAVVSRSAQIGEGVILEPFSVVNTEAVVGNGSFICAGAVVNHSANVGYCCQVDCNAVVSSYARVPDGVKVESGIAWPA